MKAGILTLVLFILTGCQAGNTKPEQPSNNGLSLYGLIFGITKDNSGSVSSVRLARVEDAMAKREIQYDLREDLLIQAKDKLSKKWNSTASEREPGVEFFVICLYTNIDPDVVKCGEE
jgi:hypothetical protein